MSSEALTGLAVAVGAAVGAPMRYVTDVVVQSRHDGLMPWGTVTVNVVGSFVLGTAAALAASSGAPPEVLALVGTGFCGALTTFSTFGYETLRLLQDGAWPVAAGYLAVSLALGFAACAAGWWLVPLWL